MNRCRFEHQKKEQNGNFKNRLNFNSIFHCFSSFNLIFLFRYTTISSQTCSHWWIQSKKLFQQSQNCIALSFMSSILFFEYIALQCEQCQQSFHYLIPLLDTAVIVPNQQKLHLRWLLQIHQVPYEFFNHLCLLLNNDEFVICDIFSISPNPSNWTSQEQQTMGTWWLLSLRAKSATRDRLERWVKYGWLETACLSDLLERL